MQFLGLAATSITIRVLQEAKGLKANRALASLYFAAMPTIILCQPSSQAGTYRAEFQLETRFGSGDRKDKVRGSLLIEEGIDWLTQRVELESGERLFFMFDGTRSWYTSGNNQVYVKSGFHYYHAPVPLYFPRNFSAKKVFYGIDESLSILKKKKEDVREGFLSGLDLMLYKADEGGRPLFDGAQLVPSKSLGLSNRELIIGTRSEPTIRIGFSNVVSQSGISLPSGIEIVRMVKEFVPSTGKSVTKNQESTTLKLTKVESNYVQASLERDLLESGLFIQDDSLEVPYSFVFDPKEGLLDAQMKKALASRKRFEREKAGGDKRSQTSIVPIAFAFTFLVLALIIVLNRRRTSR